MLSHYEEMSYEQIADVMDCSRASVESLLFRARRSLRKDFVEVAAQVFASWWVSIHRSRAVVHFDPHKDHTHALLPSEEKAVCLRR